MTRQGMGSRYFNNVIRETLPCPPSGVKREVKVELEHMLSDVHQMFQSKIQSMIQERSSLAPPIYLLPHIFRASFEARFLASNQRTKGAAENDDVTVSSMESALVDGHLHARCLVCLQSARNVIPGQTLTIGYGRSRVALGRSNSLNFNRHPPSSELTFVN